MNNSGEPKPRRPRGAGGINYDAVRGQWRISWPIPGQKPGRMWIDGSRIDADRELRRQLALRDAGSPRLDHRLTVGAWLKTWLETHVAAKSQGTQIRYRDITNRLIVPALGAIRLADLDDTDIARFKARLVRDGHTRRGADSVLDVLSAALGQAVRSRLIGQNPRTQVARERKPPQMIDPPTRDEADQILAAVADDPRWLALYGLALGHGLRQSELLGLRHGDRTADGLTLRVVRKREHRTGRLDEEPKDASVRTLRLLPWIAEALDRLGPAEPDALLFPGSRRGIDAQPQDPAGAPPRALGEPAPAPALRVARPAPRVRHAHRRGRHQPARGAGRDGPPRLPHDPPVPRTRPGPGRPRAARIWGTNWGTNWGTTSARAARRATPATHKS